MAWYANRESGQVESLVIVCGFDSHPRYCEVKTTCRLGTGEPKWL
jgi:hypothetical protein